MAVRGAKMLVSIVSPVPRRAMAPLEHCSPMVTLLGFTLFNPTYKWDQM